jgi:hypothetical protein
LHSLIKIDDYSATVLKGTITNKPEEKTGIDVALATVKLLKSSTATVDVTT